MEETVLDKPSFIYGYIYRQAEELRKETFKGYAQKEVIQILLKDLRRELKKC